jgi:molybdopterin-guanine dinucleotide biosynthesis protein A
MRRAAYVLVGGRSSRMGFDKALLPHGPATLVEHIAQQALTAAGSVALVGAPERYAHLGYPALADAESNRGPLGGIVAALAASEAEWNLVLACDMPNVSAEFLERLFEMAEHLGEGRDCLAPEQPTGYAEPLCAVYHRSALPALRAALDANRLKLQEVIRSLNVVFWRAEPRWFANMNTPEDWVAHER